MANILRMTMTDAVVANKNVDIRKSFFGLVKRAYYAPTDSPLAVKVKDLDMETGYKVKDLLDAKTDKLQQVADAMGHVEESPIGNMQLEVCVSKDGKFAAYQLLKFMGLDYRPLTTAKIYEGAEAQLVSSIL